jgi:hypothetical protein
MLGKLERREVNDKDEGEEFMMQTSEEREKLFRKRSNWCAIQGWEGRESWLNTKFNSEKKSHSAAWKTSKSLNLLPLRGIVWDVTTRGRLKPEINSPLVDQTFISSHLEPKTATTPSLGGKNLYGKSQSQTATGLFSGETTKRFHFRLRDELVALTE